jgi:plastocyanin domain-containing protein
MNDMGKVVKFFLALMLGAGLAWSARASAKEPAKPKTPPAKTEPAKAEAIKSPARVVELTVTEKGFEPSPLTVKKGQPLTLGITRKTDETCATELILPEHKLNVALPLNQRVEVSFTPDKTGQLKYGCAMGMMVAGVLVVE